MAVALRPATLADVATIQGHRDRMFLDMGLDPSAVQAASAPSRAWLTAALTDGRYHGILATLEDQTVGGIGVTWQDLPANFHTLLDHRGYLLNMFVEPAHRGRGVARLLLGAAVEHCRAAGVDIVTLHASDAGRPLYESSGFTATNEMRLRLTRE